MHRGMLAGASEHSTAVAADSVAPALAGPSVGAEPPRSDDTAVLTRLSVDELVESVLGVDREIAALHAQSTRLLAELHRRGVEAGAEHAVHDPRADRRSSDTGDREADVREQLGARIVVAEIAVARRMSEASIRIQLDEASRLAALPAVLAALDDGLLSPAHARALADGVSEVPLPLRARFENLVLPSALGGTPAAARRRARAVRERLHPQSIEIRAALRRGERRFVFEPDRDGMAWLHLHLPCVDARAAYERVDAAARSLAGAPHDPRGVGQIRADVATELLLFGDVHGDSAAGSPARPIAGPALRARRDEAERLPGRGGRYARFRPTVNVTVPVLALLGRSDEPANLEGYGPIPLGVAEEIAASAPSLTRILTHPETGTVLSVGRTSYTVPADLRRFVRLRDESCRFPGCERSAGACDIDHTRAWEHGGETAHDNLACLCRSHHRLKHASTWQVERPPGHPSVLRWTSPYGRVVTDSADPPF
ncbi:HNH endonuclease [Labedella populi]|uniref:HNH endonuclease n=1 Tax=Labedella populi TaxID=2498850 RepID=A0A3S4APK9_9MICO|nr:HNH endonuclease signature motif containing protein [Labedella populi]RWZ64676.1 HNH endonuclease [Labedella populi]